MPSPQHILVTGGCGFIGSNFIRFVLEQRPDLRVTNLDKLTYAGNPENLSDLEDDPRYRMVKGDIADASVVEPLMREVDAVVHFAAESHVDRSILDSQPFIMTNVAGTQTLLDAARKAWSAQGDGKAPYREHTRFHHVSTDEVYGSLPLDEPERKFTEDTPYDPNSPYAASKAASDMLVRACAHTFGLDCTITNCSNNFGPYHFPEKVIPLFVTNLMEDKKVPLYGDGKNVRDWLHVIDHAEAVLTVLERGEKGRTYNVGGNNERSNLELTHTILQLMGHAEEMIEHVPDRAGHDRRYAIDASRIRDQLGWTPSRSAWPDALAETIKWYFDHEDWWRRVKSGAYRDYYAAQYGS